MSGGNYSVKSNLSSPFSFNYERITLKFKKVSGGHRPHTAKCMSAPAASDSIGLSNLDSREKIGNIAMQRCIRQPE